VGATAAGAGVVCGKEEGGGVEKVCMHATGSLGECDRKASDPEQLAYRGNTAARRLCNVGDGMSTGPDASSVNTTSSPAGRTDSDVEHCATLWRDTERVEQDQCIAKVWYL